ncbi:hypothetical protein TSUD_06960 [Trifolium subterraneum]|uniref:Uncharacterized protein n=1 Tax=Trifolium subterraneum TaxID=3900 RepID=A0A2Z6PEF3_TRISU|nr:hypothetical protein TSUD_06960 [Trifolium subterraneum]
MALYHGDRQRINWSNMQWSAMHRRNTRQLVTQRRDIQWLATQRRDLRWLVTKEIVENVVIDLSLKTQIKSNKKNTPNESKYKRFQTYMKKKEEEEA